LIKTLWRLGPRLLQFGTAKGDPEILRFDSSFNTDADQQSSQGHAESAAPWRLNRGRKTNGAFSWKGLAVSLNETFPRPPKNENIKTRIL